MVSSMSDEKNLGPHDECFVFSQHAQLSLQKMESYFLKEQFTDVVLIAGAHRIPAHRLVLSAGSEYFAAMFSSNLKEGSQNEIELQNVDGGALQSLIHYCYSGRIELFKDTAETILVTAHLLLLTEVVEACCAFLKEQLHPSNCIGIGQFADSHGCTNLLKASENYIYEHFEEVIKNKEFLLLSADELANLLASDDLNVTSEEIIFHALMSWIDYDLPNRTEYVSKLLSLIRLPLLSPSFIVDHIETNEIFRHNLECRERISEAFQYQLLPERRSMLQSPRTCPRKSTFGGVYVIGGISPNQSFASVERYEVRLDKWTYFHRMSFRRLQCGIVVDNEKLYVVGGRDRLKTLNTIECFNLKTNTFTNLPAMATPRHGLGVAVLDGFLYAVGGFDGWGFLETVERWDPRSNTWSFVRPMSSQRTTVGVAVLNGKLYAVGGRDGNSCLRSVECYDPHTDKWVECARMAERRAGVGVGALNGYLYALGGREAVMMDSQSLKTVERYDPKTDSWSLVASMSMGRSAMGICVLGQKLFAVGGYAKDQYLDLAEMYHPEQNEWKQVSPLVNKRAEACVIVMKGDLKFPYP